eukprot:IDg7218t1
MPASSSNIGSLSKAAAWKRYSELVKRADNVEQKDEHFTRFILVTHTVLNQHSIFTPDFFISPIYPIRILHEVDELYDCITIDVDYFSEINLSNYEKSYKSVMAVTWLSYILGQSPSETRSSIDRHKSLRSSSNSIVRSRAKESLQSSATRNALEIPFDNYGLPETKNPMLQVPFSLPTTQAVKHEPIL